MLLLSSDIAGLRFAFEIKVMNLCKFGPFLASLSLFLSIQQYMHVP